jgi:hypothetical protein
MAHGEKGSLGLRRKKVMTKGKREMVEGRRRKPRKEKKKLEGTMVDGSDF